MKTMILDSFGVNNLRVVDAPVPKVGPGEVLIRFGAASINSRDNQIVSGVFSPTQQLPIVPVSDGAGDVVAVGDGVQSLVEGDRVCPLFFPEWLTGEALADERAVSSGLEAPGVLREYGVYQEHQVVKVAEHLSAAEASCLPCAGVTAWTSLVNFSDIQAGDWVLVQGTGGVALFGIQFAKALGAKVIVTSSSDERLTKAKTLGADHGINYLSNPLWGEEAHELADNAGVHAVLEVGGTGTLPQSVAALRRGGHINIIGYFAGIDIGLNVFHLIERNAHLHGVSVGNRDAFVEMNKCIEKHGIKPVISATYKFSSAGDAIAAISAGGHFGKLIVDFSDSVTTEI